MHVLRQTPDTPLYPNMPWGRPERKKAKGSLLIIGGNSQEFVDIQTSYAAAGEIGAGDVKVVLPDALQKLLGTLTDVEFAPSTPSGSFDASSLNTLLGFSNACDVLVMSGELSNNSETHIVIEKLSQATQSPIVLVGDSVMHAADILTERTGTSVVIGAKPQFQELIKHYKLPQTITSNSNPGHIRSALQELAIITKAILLLHHNGEVYICDGETCIQMHMDSMNHPRTAVFVAELIAEFPQTPMEAIATALYLALNN